MKLKNTFRLLTVSAGLLSAAACTNLDETLYGRLSPETYYQNEKEALSSVVGVYRQLGYMWSAGGEGWRINEFETDEFFVPGRSNGGWFSDDNMQLQSHTITPTNEAVARAWTSTFQVVGAANAVWESLNSSPMAANLQPLIGEVEAMRAYGYLFALDLWGNVPLFTGARVDATNLPTTTPRAEIYNFVVQEFKNAIAKLPSVKDVNRATYYPRFTKEAAQAALAIVYLNAEVYSGTPHWEDVIATCDAIINTNAYSLQPKVGDCFLSNNENNSEVISAIAVDPQKQVYENQFILYAQHAADQQKYNLPFGPACGYCFTDEALNRYEVGDERREVLEYGPQFMLDGVTPLMDPDNQGQQLVLTTIHDMISAQNNEGYRVLKYSPIGATFSGANGDNDFVMERYSNILLMKAEALVRLNRDLGVAKDLINQVRTRSNCPAWTEADLTLENIEAERAREFIWETKRRQDQIRFGSFFTGKWFYKQTVTDRNRGVMPIPQIQITNNPNLEQNEAYR